MTCLYLGPLWASESQPGLAGRDLVFGEGEGGYSGWSRSKENLDAAVKLKEDWTLHDLRRTAATRMADIGVQPHVIEAVLNHVSGTKRAWPAFTIAQPMPRRSERRSICGPIICSSPSPNPKAPTW